MRRIGIMGGTFDPIHIGHLMLAECAKEECDLQEIWLIPTGCSYLKAEQQNPQANRPTPAQRLEMTRLATEGVPDMRCLDIEVKRPGYTYSYETLEELKKSYPEDRFFFIVGADCLFAIESWKCPERIFDSCVLIAAVRGESPLPEMEAKAEWLRERYDAKIRLLPFRNIMISSTEIRERVKSGRSIRFMTPDQVIAYIEDKKFYRG